MRGGAGFDIRSLAAPIVAAPMAGGPSTPELAAAVGDAGGLGFLAAGYRTADDVAAQIGRVRDLTAAPFGVNLIVPAPVGAHRADDALIEAYARHLADQAARYGTAPGVPRPDDDGWAAKLELLLDLRPEVASFTFGVPEPDVVRALQSVGVMVVATVTTLGEAGAALGHGVDALVVQGPEAGGHRGTFDAFARPAGQPLDTLLFRARQLTDVPLFAAGGLTRAAQVAAALRLGATAVQAGTAFLRADEAGTNPAHRAALAAPGFGATGLTLAFSGRYARGLVNDFMRRNDPVAPFGYPQVNQLTAPIRAAAVAAGDPHGTSLWAGTGFRDAVAAPAGDVVRDLAAVVRPGG
jgi:nitronate monooxygenase